MEKARYQVCKVHYLHCHPKYASFIMRARNVRGNFSAQKLAEYEKLEGPVDDRFSLIRGMVSRVN